MRWGDWRRVWWGDRKRMWWGDRRRLRWGDWRRLWLRRWALRRPPGSPSPRLRGEGRGEGRRRAAWWAFFASGAAGVMHEVVWSRQLVPLIGAEAYAQAVALGVFMAGLAVGALLARRRADRGRPLRDYAVARAGHRRVRAGHPAAHPGGGRRLSRPGAPVLRERRRPPGDPLRPDGPDRRSAGHPDGRHLAAARERPRPAGAGAAPPQRLVPLRRQLRGRRAGDRAGRLRGPAAAGYLGRARDRRAREPRRRRPGHSLQPATSPPPSPHPPPPRPPPPRTPNPPATPRPPRQPLACSPLPPAFSSSLPSSPAGCVPWGTRCCSCA